MRRQKQRGTTLIELLVSTMMALLLGVALLSLLQTSYTARSEITVQNSNTMWARRPIDILADEIRNAQWFSNTGNSCCTSTTPSALVAATTNSVTIYNNASDCTAYTKYWYDSATSTLKKTVTTGSSCALTGTTTVLVSNVTALTFTYYVNSTANTYTGSTWNTTASAHAPTAAELPTIGAVQIQGTVAISGFSRQLTSFVRLRSRSSSEQPF